MCLWRVHIVGLRNDLGEVDLSMECSAIEGQTSTDRLQGYLSGALP